MQINQALSAYNATYQRNDTAIATQKENQPSISQNSNLNATQLTNSYFLSYQTQSFTQSSSNLSAQSALGALFGENKANIPSNLTEILNGINFDAIGYSGTPIGSLTQNEASALISEDGYFGVNNTAQRIGDFIINGAGDDLQKLQAGRDGMLQGFEEARRLWGGELPEISEQTIKLATESIDKRIAELGGNVLNVSA